MLTVVDEYTRECLAIAVRRRMRASDVQEVRGELFLTQGCPTPSRSDNGLEFIATGLVWPVHRRPLIHRARQSVREPLCGVI